MLASNLVGHFTIPGRVLHTISEFHVGSFFGQRRYILLRKPARLCTFSQGKSSLGSK
jgi:hypothetical protein